MPNYSNKRRLKVMMISNAHISDMQIKELLDQSKRKYEPYNDIN